MTYLTQISASDTNPQSATKGFPLETKAHSKNDNFKTRSYPEMTRKEVSLGDYDERIEGKRERLEARAIKAHEKSNAHYAISSGIAGRIPFGQPILVGHHSEGRARRDAARISNNMAKCVAEDEKAKDLENRASNIGTGGIASDDVNAIQKLEKKCGALENTQKMMKAVNKIIRASKMNDAERIDYMIKNYNFTSVTAKEILEPDFCGRVGFPSYRLQNNNATIKTARKRLKSLEIMHNQKPLVGSGEVEGIEWKLYEEEGRIKFCFSEIPTEQMRKTIKDYGFKWSRYSSAWVRKITPNAIFVAKRLVHQIEEKKV